MALKLCGSGALRLTSPCEALKLITISVTIKIVKQIEFLGASSDQVTGSNYVLTAADGNQALIDFGMFQGSDELDKRNFLPLNFNPPALQAVFITHGHLDHTGRLPLLVFGGYTGKIYMTEPTRAFADIILRDSARIAEMDRTRREKQGRSP